MVTDAVISFFMHGCDISCFSLSFGEKPHRGVCINDGNDFHSASVLFCACFPFCDGTGRPGSECNAVVLNGVGFSHRKWYGSRYTGCGDCDISLA